MLDKYPDIGTILRQTGHKDLTLGGRYSRNQLSLGFKAKSPDSKFFFSHSVGSSPNKLNTFNSKRASPLPPLTFSVDLPVEFLRIVAEEKRTLGQSGQILKKLWKCPENEGFYGSCMRRSVRGMSGKAGKNAGFVSKEQWVDNGNGFGRKSGIYQRVNGKVKLNRVEKVRRVLGC